MKKNFFWFNSLYETRELFKKIYLSILYFLKDVVLFFVETYYYKIWFIMGGFFSLCLRALFWCG